MRQSTAAVTRPPAQFVKTPGTQFRYESQDYDKNKYAQCGYASFRTLIQCTEIRSKEALAKNGGACEEHIEYSIQRAHDHKKEVHRVNAENDTRLMRRRNDPWIVSNTRIDEEDDYLQAVDQIPMDQPNRTYSNPLDEHPLRYAGHYTDKDVIRVKIDMVSKDCANLEALKDYLHDKKTRDYARMGDDDESDMPIDMAQSRVYHASKHFNDRDTIVLTTIDPVYKRCDFGPDMNDADVIRHTVTTLLNKIDGFKPCDAEKQCFSSALPGSTFCREHVAMDSEQVVYRLCSVCGEITFRHMRPLCTHHIKARLIDSNAACKNKSKDGEPSPLPETKLPEKCELNDSSTSSDDLEEDIPLANLSRIQAMASPMQQYSMPSSPSPVQSNFASPPLIRRYQGPPAQLLRPPQMGPPPNNALHPNRIVAHPRYHQQPQYYQQIQQQQQLHQQQQQKAEPIIDDERSKTCARIRPIEKNQFGTGKRKSQIAAAYGHHTKKMMPSLLSSPPDGAGPSSAGTSRAGPSYYGYQNRGGRNVRFPINRPTMGQRPVMIPLTDRSQEPKTADELVEDRGSSPTPKYPGSEPPRRGVPYYKNVSSLRRREGVNTVASPLLASSSMPIPPPPSSAGPPPQRYRHPGARAPPVAPHRAIAAGLNPADVVNPSLPLPSFKQPAPLDNQPGPSSASSASAPSSGFARPTTTTTSYRVVSSSSVASPSSSPLQLHPSSSTSPVQVDARFAKMNVKTFLSMNPEELKKMTQSEIDKLTRAEAMKARKGPTPAHLRSPGSQEHQLPIHTATPIQIAPGVVAVPVVPIPPSRPTPKKRKIEEPKTETAVASSSDAASASPEVTSPPVAKRSSVRRSSVEKEPRKKTPKREIRKSTPPTSSGPSVDSATPSGRTPRAAAVAANQAIIHHKPTSSTSTPSAAAAPGAPDEAAPRDPNPLSLLAALAEQEDETPRGSSATSSAISPQPRNNKKTPKKASPKPKSSSSEQRSSNSTSSS